MKYTHVIWDFNGTILDDVSVGIDSVNVLLAKRGLPTLKCVEDYRGVFGFPIIEYYERLGFDFTKESYADVAVEWVDEYMSRVPCAPVNDGVVRLLQKIKENHMGQSLISATEINMLKKQLEMLGVSEFFDGVYGLDNIHAVNKTALARVWREQHQNEKVVFIGDTDHDFETAQAIGADCLLYCGGHQGRAALTKLGCPVAEKFSELENIIFA